MNWMIKTLSNLLLVALGFSSSVSPALGLNMKQTKSDIFKARRGGETIYKWLDCVTLDCLIKRFFFYPRPNTVGWSDPYSGPLWAFFFLPHILLDSQVQQVSQIGTRLLSPPASPHYPPPLRLLWPLVRSVTGTAPAVLPGIFQGWRGSWWGDKKNPPSLWT